MPIGVVQTTYWHPCPEPNPETGKPCGYMTTPGHVSTLWHCLHCGWFGPQPTSERLERRDWIGGLARRGKGARKD